MSPDQANPRRFEHADAQMVSPKELALLWKVFPSTVRRTLRRAGVKAYLIGEGRGGTVRYRKEDIDGFLARRQA